MKKNDIKIAKNLYKGITTAMLNFKRKMIEVIGDDDLELYDEFGAYDDMVDAQIINRHGEKVEVAIDKVRYKNCLFEFHACFIDNEEADEWLYDGLFVDDICDLLFTALPIPDRYDNFEGE